MNEEKLGRVENYLAKKMSVQERSSFEKDLEADAELEEILETYQISNAMIEVQQRQLLKQQLFAKRVAIREIEQSRVIKFRQNLRIAASVGILIIAGVLIWRNVDEFKPRPSKINPQALNAIYQEQVGRFPFDGTTLGNPSETEQLYTKGNAFLKQAQYDSALTYLTQLRQIDSTAFYPTTVLMTGYAQLQKGNLSVALQTFNSIPTDLPEARRTANWYIVLTYIKQKQYRKAAEALKRIANDPNAGEYQQRAQEILKRIAKR